MAILLAGALSAACEDGVAPPAAPLSLQPGSAVLSLGDTLRLIAGSGERLLGAGVTWRSLDEAIVAVDSTGLVTAVGAGDAMVIAGFGDRAAAAALRVTVSFASLFVGSDFACGRAAGGETFCWGSNEWGQWADGVDYTLHSRPQRVSALDRFDLLVAGTTHACGRVPSGQAWCWGNNAYGQLGRGVGDTASADPRPVTGARRFVRLTTRGSYTCGIATDGAAYCWGWSGSGALGADTIAACRSGPCSPVPIRVQGGRRFVRLSAGDSHTCGVTGTGDVFCWGSNFRGQLSLPDSVEQVVEPARVEGLGPAADVEAGESHTCALQTDGRAFCWGWSRDGTLGNGTLQSFYQYNPVEVVGNLRFTTLAAGRFWGRGTFTVPVMCAVTTEDEAYCWGTGRYGQTGTGSADPLASPAAVAGGLRFARLALGAVFSCGLTPDGAAYCWGSNIDGRLGRDDVGRSFVPLPVLPPVAR